MLNSSVRVSRRVRQRAYVSTTDFLLHTGSAINAAVHQSISIMSYSNADNASNTLCASGRNASIPMFHAVPVPGTITLATEATSYLSH